MPAPGTIMLLAETTTCCSASWGVMPWVPYGRYAIATAHSPAAVADRLRAQVEPVRWFRFSRAEHPLELGTTERRVDKLRQLVGWAGMDDGVHEGSSLGRSEAHVRQG